MSEQPDGDRCPKSRNVNELHSWRFDGDDPYMVCMFCGELRDAITGQVIRAGADQ